MKDRLEDGSTVVFTPHFSCFMSKRVVDSRRSRSTQFQDQMEEKYSPGIEFLTAGELLIRGISLKHMEETRYAGTGWVLVEFTTDITWLETLIQLRRLIRRGYSPLLAHPERYSWCRLKRDRMVKLSRMGCGSIVSARSFRLEKYASTARHLLKEGLSHALCSDAHSSRDSILDSSLRRTVEEFSLAPWNVLTSKMPELILNDMKLPELPLLPLQEG